MLSSSKIEEVSQNRSVFDVIKFQKIEEASPRFYAVAITWLRKPAYGGQTVAVGCLLVRGSISTKLVSPVCRLHFQMSWWFE